MLSPIVWECVSRHGAKWQLALAWLGTAAVVLLASNRESWVVFAVATLMWTWVYARRLGLHPIKLLIPMALAAMVIWGGVYQVNPKFAQRVDQSTSARDLGYESLNAATSFRLHLWNNALSVLENHPVNGAGVRSYRYAYAKYAEASDPYLSPDGTGRIYAHQLALEVGAETGAIGLAGLLGFFVVFIWSGRGIAAHPLPWTAWLGAFAWLFPLNTTLRFIPRTGHYWSDGWLQFQSLDAFK